MKNRGSPQAGAAFATARENSDAGQARSVQGAACGVLQRPHGERWLMPWDSVSAFPWPRTSHGIIDDVARGVTSWKKSQKVGVGLARWTRLHCCHAPSRRFIHCANNDPWTGHPLQTRLVWRIMIEPWEAVAATPSVDPVEARPYSAPATPRSPRPPSGAPRRHPPRAPIVAGFGRRRPAFGIPICHQLRISSCGHSAGKKVRDGHTNWPAHFI